MKQFVRLAICVFLMVSVIITVCLLLMIKNNDADMDNNYRYTYLTNHASEIKTLILGHSHTAVGIDENLIDSAFNMASYARISYYDAELLQHFAPLMPNLRAVIYPLIYEYEAGNFYIDSEFRKDQLFQYEWYYRIAPEEEYNTLASRFYIMKRIFNYESLHYSYEGATIVPQTQVGNARLVYFAPGCRSSVKKSLLKMSKICEQYNLRLIVVTFPANSTYLSQSVDSVGIHDLNTLMDSIDNAEYRNYLYDSEFKNDSLFSDQTHFNQRGATLFSLRIKEDFGL